MRPVFLFGLVFLVYVGVLAMALSAPIALTVSYLVAARLYVRRSVGGRRLAQIGVFVVTQAVLTVGFIALIFAGLGGEGGGTIRVFGVDLFAHLPITPLLVASVLILLVGEPLLIRRRRVLLERDAPADPKAP